MKHVRFIKVENLIVLSQSRQIAVNYIFSNWSQYQHCFKAYLDSQPTQKNSKIDLHAEGASFEKPISRSLKRPQSVLRLCATNFIDSMFVSKSQWEKIMGFIGPYWYFCPFRGARTEFNFSLYLKAHRCRIWSIFFTLRVCPITCFQSIQGGTLQNHKRFHTQKKPMLRRSLFKISFSLDDPLKRGGA